MNDPDPTLLYHVEQWREHRDPAALRQYPHLLLGLIRAGASGDALRRLYALARDEDGARQRAQEATFPADIDLPLQTVQAALLAAMHVHDVGAMATFLLIHAMRAQALRSASPLAAARSALRARAAALVTRRGSALSVLWSLLLAWEYQETGRPHAARATLSRLQHQLGREWSERPAVDWWST